MNIQQAIQEIKQSRSKYQLLNFAIKQHDTPEMCYYQLVVEAAGLVETIKRTKLEILKIEAQNEELLETGKRSDAIEVEIKKLDIEQKRLHLIGAERELKYLTQLFEQSPKYTREQIEAGQAEYWEKRLMRVAQLQAMAGGVNWAQLEAIHQAGLLDKVLTSGNPIDYLDLPTYTRELEEKNKNG